MPQTSLGFMLRDAQHQLTLLNGRVANLARRSTIHRFGDREVMAANRAYYGATAPAYDRLNGPRDRTRHWLKEKLCDAIDTERPPGRVLDIGTGTGFALEAVAALVDPKHTSLVGCDVSRPMLELASHRVPNAELVSYDGFVLPFDKATFDLVLVVSVLHHARDPFPLLAEAARVLSPKGHIIVLQEPNPAINGIVRRLRNIFRQTRDEVMALAEFHQMITNGIEPSDTVSFLRRQGLSTTIDYNNAALLDAIESRIGRRAVLWLAPLMRLRSRWSCLSYSIVARGYDARAGSRSHAVHGWNSARSGGDARRNTTNAL